MANSAVKEKSVETRSKKAGKILLIASIALVVLWAVLLVLRFTVFQNHDSLGNYLGNRVASIWAIFHDLCFFESFEKVGWMIAGWLYTLFVVGFVILLVLELIDTKKKRLILSIIAVTLTLIPVLDFVGLSGDYIYNLSRFVSKNTFAFIAILGFLILSFIIVVTAILGTILLVKQDKVKEEGVDQSLFKNKHRFNFRGSLCMPYALFMFLFVVLPLLLIVFYAFTDPHGNFTFSNWKTVFTDSKNWEVIGTTFLLSAISTVVCLLIAYPIAYLLSNKKYNKNKILVYIFLLPMWINFVVRTMGLKDLLNGLTSTWFGFNITSTYRHLSIVIGMVYDYLPFAILPLYNQMLKMDKNQIEAAADLGANPAQVFIKNIIPMTIPGIVSACMMTFMPTMSSFVIADYMSERRIMIIGGLINDWFNVSYSETANNVGSVISLMMLFIIGVTLVIEKTITRKEEESKKVGIW